MENQNVLYPSLFEDDYIIRSMGTIVTQPDVALTELVANAWDAGASHVKIFIPDQINEVLWIEDDGVGMTEDEFQNHWMKMRYNRLRSQGKTVVFPNGISGNRTAFGRNGVGRHGLFCFGDQYKVITQKDGKKITLTVKQNVDHNPMAVIYKSTEESLEHGTRLEVIVERNRPKVEKIREILSARFLHDPQFSVEVNNMELNLDSLASEEPKEINVEGTTIHLTAYFIDTTKTSRKSIFQGIAFWQSGRLVGNPSWTLGDRMVLDGRTSLAKRYTFVIKSNDLSDFVKEDWSGFRDSVDMQKVYDAVSTFVDDCLKNVSAATIESVIENLDSSIKNSLKDVNPLFRMEVNQAIKTIVEESPKVKQDSVDLAVKTLVNYEKAKNGHDLLEKLSRLSADDLDGLNELLGKWNVSDAMIVLNEIDRRLTIIEAIRKLSSDSTTDELHVLHPMIAESRWLFGPEYESSEYIFNRQMKTAVAKIFGENKLFKADINYSKRPDLICLENSTIGVTGIEDITDESEIVHVRKLLLIELKKGAFKIDRTERNQAQGYIEDLLRSNLGVNCQIVGFIVGASLSDNIEYKTKIGDNGMLYSTTYDKLVDTAEKRMFGLRQTIASRYEEVPGMTLYAQAKLSL